MKKMRNYGFSLIEVLIALLVLSVGLLGMAGLQGYSLSSGYDAHLRTQANILTQDILASMRANHVVANANYYETSQEELPKNARNCNVSTCTPLQFAKFDVLEWKCRLGAHIENKACAEYALQAALPAGDGEILQLVNRQIQITVKWAVIDSEGVDRQVRIVTRI